jgi:hypothetical protein
VSDLKALHEAANRRAQNSGEWSATLDPRICNAMSHRVESGEWLICYARELDAALIVALRNAYADGTLVERTPTSLERMSEDAWSEVAAEMRSALDKHGPRYMGNLTDRALMLAVLTEEVGEVARHVCDGTDWHDEMVQVAAMAMAALHADTHPERAYATSLERKPLDGYDWRAWRCACGDGVPDEMAAYIEALEAK